MPSDAMRVWREALIAGVEIGGPNAQAAAAVIERAIADAVEKERARLRSSSVIEYLLGEGPLDGCQFGEKPEHERGNFWWRKHLRAALKAWEE